MILACDVGGTKTVLALYAANGEPRSPAVETVYPSRDFPDLLAIVDEFLGSEKPNVRRACFGLPGAVFPGRSELPNLGWTVDTNAIASRVGAPSAFLNDLEATGHGIPVLTPDELFTLHAGQPDPRGNAVLIAPGTGLGECILFWDGAQHRPTASEGGHCDFAPRTAEQIRFLEWVMENKMARVSFDRVASGSGLPLIYEYMKAVQAADEPEDASRAIAEADDPSAEISQQALSGASELCKKVLNFWAAALGAEAGNLALKGLATAGVFLGGGIPPKVLPGLQSGDFMRAFQDKGRLTDVVQRIPVKIILNQRTALYGSARYALYPANFSEF